MNWEIFFNQELEKNATRLRPILEHVIGGSIMGGAISASSKIDNPILDHDDPIHQKVLTGAAIGGSSLGALKALLNSNIYRNPANVDWNDPNNDRFREVRDVLYKAYQENPNARILDPRNMESYISLDKLVTELNQVAKRGEPPTALSRLIRGVYNRPSAPKPLDSLAALGKAHKDHSAHAIRKLRGFL